MKKQRGKGKEIAVRKQGTAMAGKLPSWKKDLVNAVQDQRAPEEATVGSKISARGGKFSFRGMPLDMPMKAIIVDFVCENKWYEEAFDEENPTPPTCYALGVDEKTMAPDNESLPDQQADTCAACPKNVFGSSDRGRGKACSNRRRLAIISADTDNLDADYIAATEIAILELSPLALRGWKTFIQKVRDGLGTSEQFVIAEFDTEQAGSVYAVTVAVDEELDDKEVCMAIMARRDEARKMLMQGYDYSGAEADERPRKKSKPEKTARPGMKSQQKQQKQKKRGGGFR